MDFSTWLLRLTDLSSVARTEEALKAALPDLVADLGFDSYAYLYVQPKRTHAISNYAPEWQRHYFEQRFETIDPVVKRAKSSQRAFIWNCDCSRRVKSKEERRFNCEAAEHGIRSGITIPIRTACRHLSMLTLASSKPELTLEKDIDPVAAATAVAFLHARIEDIGATPTALERVELTPRQALCLKWSAEGRTMREIADLENMSFATANFHLNNARKVLDALSLAQATAMATKIGLI